MNLITYDVYKNTVKKHDGFNPVTSENNYSQLRFNFKKGDDWEKCSIVTASFWQSVDDIVKSDASIIAENLSATFEIPEEFSGVSGSLCVGLQGTYNNENNSPVTIATNIIVINRNNGIVVKEGANTYIYEKLISLVQSLFDEDSNKIDSFINETSSQIKELEEKRNKVSTVDFQNSSESNYPSIAALYNYHNNYVATCYEDIENLGNDKADKEETLAGYGITDAYTKEQTNNNFLDVSSFAEEITGANKFNPICVIPANIDGASKTIVDSPSSRLGYVECKPDTTYTIIRQEPISSRFIYGTTNVEPADGVTVNDVKFRNDLTSATFVTGTDAKYIVFYFYLASQDGEYSQTFAEKIMIAEGEKTEFESFYVSNKMLNPSKIPDGSIGTNKLSSEVNNAISLGEKQINKINSDSEIKDEKQGYPSISYLKSQLVKKIDKSLTFSDVEGKNLFNPANIISANIDGASKTIVDSPSSRLGYVECKPDTTYTIIRQAPISSRFIYGTTNVEPAGGVTVNDVRFNNTLTSTTFVTGANAKYIVFYFYIASQDGEYNQEIAERIMVAEDEVSEFEPYSLTLQLKDNCIPNSVVERLNNIEHEIGISDEKNKLSTKSKIYGVRFNNSKPISTGERIESASRLNTNFEINGTFYNEGGNDFDSIFPWCGIRRCNLSVDENGIKTIVYEGEDGFSLDGANGNVMVEIPKFYSYREVMGEIETWAVTGEPKSGFNVEPAFVDSNGNELDYIYIAPYQFNGTSSTTIHSKSGELVQTGLSLSTYRNIANKINMTCMDYATLHAIQQLFVVEFADRNTDPYMQGFSFVPYFSSSNSPITGVNSARNKVSVGIGEETSRTSNFRVGQIVLICKGTTTLQENITIIEVSRVGDSINLTFDVPLNDSIDINSDSVYVAGQAQKTGTCDLLAYHTGRISDENNLSTFRYRWIENIWGNAWEILEGIRVKDLKYYYTFNPSQYSDETVENWNECNYCAPEQKYLGDDGKGRAWIKQMGYDVNNRQLVLPSKCTDIDSEGNPIEVVDSDEYYSSALYTQYLVDRYGNNIENPSVEYLCTFGGGFDHNVLCGLFTMRFWFTAGKDASRLHTTRLIFRG